MQKLRLEDLAVESFNVAATDGGSDGTVHAHLSGVTDVNGCPTGVHDWTRCSPYETCLPCGTDKQTTLSQ